MRNTIEGKSGIKATVICDSISEMGTRLLTFEVEFPRYILSEYNTHRMFSRNAASTRAIPTLRMLEQICESPAMPSCYGKNQSGMLAKEELNEESKKECEAIIKEMAAFCTDRVKKLTEIGLHKQHAGRYIEPWQTVKGVLSFTEGANWYWLRDDEAAQPEIAELARCMKLAQDQSAPQLLKAEQYHLPYVEVEYDQYIFGKSFQRYVIKQDVEGWGEVGYYITLEQAIKVSCARCAAVSYRGIDYTLEKCLQLYDRLIGSEKKHSSALEHVAYPRRKTGMGYINDPSLGLTWERGISHVDKDGQFWSGNFRDFIQHRKTIVGENYTG